MRRDTSLRAIPSSLKKIYSSGVSLSGIARMFNVSAKTAHRWIQKESIQPHPRGYLVGEKHPRWKGGIVLRNGRVYVRLPFHPRAGVDGYVAQSILVWELHHGCRVPPTHEIHHRNEITDDDRPSNLQCLTKAIHRQLHAQLRKLKKETQ